MSQVRVPAWAVGAVLAVAGIVGGVISVDGRYAKESELARHIEQTAGLYATREQLDQRTALRDAQVASHRAEDDAKFLALADQVKRLAEIMEEHTRLPSHPGTAEEFRSLEGRLAGVEANQRWSIEALQALLRRQGLTTPVAPPPTSPPAK